MKKLLLFTSFCILFSNTNYSQTAKDVDQIIQFYDLSKIKQTQAEFKKKEDADKKRALFAAKINNWPTRIVGKDGSISELMKLGFGGFPIYYSTTNAAAAKSTRATHLNTGGTLSLTLNGLNMVARVWDGGTVRSSHNLFTGRVTVVDQPTSMTYAAHSTHVTGTVMASNASATTKGMAYEATARTFEWTNDTSEAISETLGGMLISNHSYGVPIVGSTGTVVPAWYIGSYTQDAMEWDQISHLAPYYLPVMSSGNDGTTTANPDPIAAGYDKLTGDKTAKNSLIVANANDAVIAINGALTSVTINTSSSQGPTDDNRIKPDITGNGTGVTSANSTTNTSIISMTGTSMASPNVAGTLLLVQQHYKNLTGSFMKAATLKGLACHTADDAGPVGPDPTWGWGLLNAKKAAESLTGNGLTAWVSEEKLLQGQSFTTTVRASATEPLIASVTWTDVPGTPNLGNLPPNDPVKALVNDLDIRITKTGVTSYPWRLGATPSSLALRNGDNAVDNVEAVKIDTPTAADYVITVTHKGTLSGGFQNYALVITGISSGFSIIPTSSDLVVCSNQNAVFTFNYKQTGAGTTNFTAVGLPAGATASFDNNSLSANGTVTMTISGLSSAAPGDYTVGIKGDNGTETETRSRIIRVYSTNFNTVALNSPSNNQTPLSTTVNLKWAGQVNAENYTVQVSTSSSFASFFQNTSGVTPTNLVVSGLAQDTDYYWRVIPVNRCGSGLDSGATVYHFKTGIIVCGTASFSGTDFSLANIVSTAGASAEVPVTVTGGHTIGDMNVYLNLTHTYIQDMTISLVGPAAIGSPEVYLFKETCGDHDDIDCTLDDSGVAPQCSGIPSVSGSVIPFSSLSSLNALAANGEWKLKVVDPYNGDGGSINAVRLDLCVVTPSLGISENILSNIAVYPNPTEGVLNINLPENIGISTLKLFDIQGRQIFEKSTDLSNEILNINDLQNGIYLLSVENGKEKITRKIVLNK